jgi:hypothetical protein
VITSSGVVANASGQSYKLAFDYGTAVYTAAAQATSASEGLLVEILRADDTVLASDTFLPGAWGPGNYNLDAGLQGSVSYTGDGSGDVRIRIGPSNFGSGRFAGTIDNLSLYLVLDGTYDVTFGTDPNMADLVANTLYAGVTSPLTVPPFAAETDYYWQVFIDVNSPVFNFRTANQAPIADAGGDLDTWLALGNRPLDGTGSVDPDLYPITMTYLWEITSSSDPCDPATFIGSPTSSALSIVLPTIGTYTVDLTVDDGEDSDTDTNTITVYVDSCEHAKGTGTETDPGDLNDDCITDDGDIEIMAGEWRLDGRPATPPTEYTPM